MVILLRRRLLSPILLSVTLVVICGNIGWYPIRAGAMPPCPHAVAVLPPLPQAFRNGKSDLLQIFSLARVYTAFIFSEGVNNNRKRTLAIISPKLITNVILNN